MICPIGDTPFPNQKAREGRIIRRLPTALPAKSAAAKPDSAADFIVEKLSKTIIPKINLEACEPGKAVDVIAEAGTRFDPESDPTKKGVSFLFTKGRPVGGLEPPVLGAAVPPKVTYLSVNVPLLTALTEIARQGKLDAYITSMGIVVCARDVDPFPTGKAETEDVLMKLPTDVPLDDRPPANPVPPRPSPVGG